MDAFLLFAVEPLQLSLGRCNNDVRPGDGQGGYAASELLQALPEEQSDARQAGAVHERAPGPRD